MARLTAGGVPPSQVELLSSCLEDEPSDRPTNAGALADQLAAMLDRPAPTCRSIRPAPAKLVEQIKAVARPIADWPAQLVNSVGMRFVLIPAGTFRMGSPSDEAVPQ